LAEEEIVTDAVCFHCQQAVEKLLKAYLISKNVEFGRIHDLETLLKLGESLSLPIWNQGF